MKVLDLLGLPLKKRSAQLAKQRLQIILSHADAIDYGPILPALKADLIATIQKHLSIDADNIQLHIQEEPGTRPTLELNVSLSPPKP